MLRCLATTGMPRWRDQHDLKLVWLCWSPTSSPQATASASIPRTENTWNEFEALCFNTTRWRGDGLPCFLQGCCKSSQSRSAEGAALCFLLLSLTFLARNHII